MKGNGNGEEVFKVEPLSGVKQQIRIRYQEAKERGKGAAFISSMKQINRRLEKDPREFGEPLFRRPNAQLVVRVAALAPIYVRYAVHEEKPAVFLMEVKLLSS